VTELTKLKRVAHLHAGGTPPVDDPSMWSNDGLPWASIADMTREGELRSTKRCLSTKGLLTSRLPVGQPGTVLFAMYASVGALSVLGVKSSWNQAILGIEPFDRAADSRFIRYWLEHLRPGLIALARSNTQDNLNAEQVGNLPFPTITTVSQKEIADYLDEETTRINELIEAKRRLLQLLAERDHSMLSHLVFPRGRRLARLRYFATLQTGLTVASHRSSGLNAEVHPYLRVANVQSGRLDLTDVAEITVPKSLAARSMLRKNDVLMTEGGDIDKLGRGTVWDGAIPNCLHQNHIFAVRPRPSQLDPWYLSLLTQSSHGRSYFERTGVQSTNLASTNSSKILDFPIPVIPLEDQRAIVAQWKLQSEPTIQAREALSQQIHLLKERRQALVTAAVTGQLDIPEAA
jgi:type I restriction enzyme S subunit